MRFTLPLLIIIAWAVAPMAQAQTAATHPADARKGAIARPAAHPSPHPRSHHPRSPDVGANSHGNGHTRASAPAGKGDGVLTLGATDITGNKELPKVMVIVPWKPSAGADQMVRPTDSLMDEMLGPVDRGMFQRQIRYYGQLNSGRVAPVGDSH